MFENEAVLFFIESLNSPVAPVLKVQGEGVGCHEFRELDYAFIAYLIKGLFMLNREALFIRSCMLIIILMTPVSLQAAVNNPRSSIFFPYKYEGGAITQDGSTASGFGNTGYTGSMTGSTLASNGDILSIATTGPGVLYLQNSTWNSQARQETGWTWEARLKIKNVVSQGAFYFRVGDGQSGDLEEIFIWKTDRIKGYASDGWGLINTTNDFHVYRIAQAPNSDLFNVWIDGALIREGVGTLIGQDHWWSDGSGSDGGAFDLDYMRWTPGAYSPGNSSETLIEIVQTDSSTCLYEDEESIDTYKVVFNGSPGSMVNVRVSPSSTDIKLNENNAGQAIDLVFLPTGDPLIFPEPQTVVVKAIDNNLVQGLHVCQITHTTQSQDVQYTGISVSSVSVQIRENDGLEKIARAFDERELHYGKLKISIGPIRKIKMNAKYPRLIQFDDGSMVMSTSAEKYGEANSIRSEFAGVRWKPFESALTEQAYCGMLVRNNGTTVVFSRQILPIVGEPGYYTTTRWESLDNGITTQGPYTDGRVYLPPEQFSDALEQGFYGNIIKLDDNSVVAAMHGQYPYSGSNSYRSYLVRSTDEGVNWTYLSTITDNNTVENLTQLQSLGWPLRGPCEPYVLNLGNGKMICVMRMTDDESQTPKIMVGSAMVTYSDLWYTVSGTEATTIPALFANRFYTVGNTANVPLLIAESNDAGITWSIARTMSMARGHSPQMAISNGILALSYGALAAPQWGNAIVFSLDGGNTWTDEIIVAPFFTSGYTQLKAIGNGKFLYVFDCTPPQPSFVSEAHWVGAVDITVDYASDFNAADLNFDGVVDVHDFLVIANNWLEDGCIFAKSCQGADLSHNCLVDICDVANLAQSWLDGLLKPVRLIETGEDTCVDEGNSIGDSYEICLGEMPINPVTISSYNADGQINFPNGNNVVITELNWNQPQFINVIATEDSEKEGFHVAKIAHSVQSEDARFNSYQLPDTYCSIKDNDAVFAVGSPNPARTEIIDSHKITIKADRVILRDARSPMTVKLSDGSILLTGSTTVKSSDGGNTWATGTFPSLEHNVIQFSNGLLYYLMYQPTWLSSGTWQTTYYTSSNGGTSRTGPYYGTLTLPTDKFTSSTVIWFHDIIQMPDNHLLAILLEIMPGTIGKCHLVESVNLGISWTYVSLVASTGTISDPEGKLTQYGWPLQGCSEPSLIYAGDNNLVVVMRAGADDDSQIPSNVLSSPMDDYHDLFYTVYGSDIYSTSLPPELPRDKFYMPLVPNVPLLITFSSDGGLHWSAAVPMDEARGVFPRLARSDDGILALSYGSLGYPRFGHAIKFSYDNGQTWTSEIKFGSYITTGYTRVIATGNGKFKCFYDCTPPMVWNSTKRRWIGMIDIEIE